MYKALHTLGSILVAGAFGSLCLFTDGKADIYIALAAMVLFIAGSALMTWAKDKQDSIIELFMESEKADKLHTATDYITNKYGN